jgi:hypothetical protein
MMHNFFLYWGLMLARQVLYHLSHATSLLGGWLFLWWDLSLCLDLHPPICAFLLSLYDRCAPPYPAICTQQFVEMGVLWTLWLGWSWYSPLKKLGLQAWATVPGHVAYFITYGAKITLQVFGWLGCLGRMRSSVGESRVALWRGKQDGQMQGSFW